MRGSPRGGTLKECQSDFRRVHFPPLLVTFGGKSLRGVLEGTMTQRDLSCLLQLIMMMPKDDNNNK